MSLVQRTSMSRQAVLASSESIEADRHIQQLNLELKVGRKKFAIVRVVPPSSGGSSSQLWQP